MSFENLFAAYMMCSTVSFLVSQKPSFLRRFSPMHSSFAPTQRQGSSSMPWVNDRDTLRRAGAASDLYASMLAAGEPPDEWSHLLAAAQEPEAAARVATVAPKVLSLSTGTKAFHVTFTSQKKRVFGAASSGRIGQSGGSRDVSAIGTR